MPDTIRDDMAFIDRLHFYLPGWEIPQMRNNLFTDHYGFVVDYLPEALREMRRHIFTEISERYFSMEHALMMIIAWLLVHVGRSMVKRGTTDAQKHKRTLIYFGIALIIILLMIPWPFKQPGIGRQLFPPF